MSMACPKCDKPSGVEQTRGRVRQRYCRTCNHQFWTQEEYLEAQPVGVYKDCKHGE